MSSFAPPVPVATRTLLTGHALWFRSTAPAGAAAQAVIEVVSAEGTVVKTLPIGTRRCTVVGRLGDVCDEVVDEPSASRKHLAVAYSGAERQFYVRTGR